MSVVFDTTMEPTKHELLAGWMPRQSWFEGELPPVLSTVGGFRLDDPAGEVGMEMILAFDVSPVDPVLYHVPLSYRGAELEGAEAFLLGTSEHGVLGTRWIYDAAGDPVWQAQMRVFFAGEVAAQHQTESHALDPSIKVVQRRGERPDGENPRADLAVIRRPSAGRTGSAGARAWVNAQWTDTDGKRSLGAVVELA